MTAAALAALIVLCAGPQPAAADSSPARKLVFVICLAKDGAPGGRHAYRPRACALHARGAFPIGAANTEKLRRLRWKRWSARRAVGRGGAVLPAAGEIRVRVELRRPRFRCGEWVFTRARVTERRRLPAGKATRSTRRIKLDVCLPLRRR